MYNIPFNKNDAYLDCLNQSFEDAKAGKEAFIKADFAEFDQYFRGAIPSEPEDIKKLSPIPKSSHYIEEDKKFLQKKVRFVSVPNEESDVATEEKKKKLNSLSARRSRLKKKKYIEDLENSIKELKSKLSEYEASNKKQNKKIAFQLNKLNQVYSSYSQLLDANSKDTAISEHNKLQLKTITDLLIMQLYVFMPLNLRNFQEKYLKLETFDNDDSLASIKAKINNNIKSIKEIYYITGNGSETFAQKESIPFRLLNYYTRLGEFVDHFGKFLSQNK